MSGSEDLYTIAVPQDDLQAPQGGGHMPAGEYRTTLQAGASIADGQNGWQGLRLPFQGFSGIGKNAGQEFPNRDVRAQFTIAHDSSPEAVRIGRNAVIGAAQALGIAETDGKTVRLTANNNEELVEQFNALAGTPVGVYITAKKSDRLKNDGTPFINNEVSRVFSLEGK